MSRSPLLDLLSWLELADLEAARASEVLLLVREALEGSGEMRPLLEACCQQLEWGDIPVSELGQLRQECAGRLEESDPGAPHEAHLRQLAEQLTEEQLHTTRLQTLLSWRKDPEAIKIGLGQLEQEIQAAWESYAATPVAGTEVTVEAVVGHRLLLEGLQDWLTALEEVRAGNFDLALALARQGNRILLALQHFQRGGLDTHLR